MTVAPIVIRARPKRPVNSRPVLASALNAGDERPYPLGQARRTGADEAARREQSQTKQNRAKQEIEAHGLI